MKHKVATICFVSFVIPLLVWGCVAGKTKHQTARDSDTRTEPTLSADEELARLLVKLEKQTRAVVAGHYVAADTRHRSWMANHVLLPAAVADKVFYEVVPDVTGGRAWVKMVVEKPRNPHNLADTTADAMLDQLMTGCANAERRVPEACYYAEPIKAAKTCLQCHGDPRGAPDPFFPQYKKNGWREGQVVGAIVARVATRE